MAFVPLVQSQPAHQVVAHVRPGSSSLEEVRAKFEPSGALIDLTPWELEAMAEAIATHRPDVVCCFIGTTRARMKQLEAKGQDAAKASYEAVDYGLTDLLVRASVLAAERHQDYAPPRFVYISAMGAGSRGLNAYMKARWKAEQSIMDSGLPYAIARPGFISGEDRQEARTMERVGAKLSDALFKTLGALGADHIARTYMSTDAEELSRALLRLAQSSEPALIAESAELKDDAGA